MIQDMAVAFTVLLAVRVYIGWLAKVCGE